MDSMLGKLQSDSSALETASTSSLEVQCQSFLLWLCMIHHVYDCGIAHQVQTLACRDHHSTEPSHVNLPAKAPCS